MKYLILFLIFPFISYSQEQDDVADVPKPDIRNAYFDRPVVLNTKTITMITHDRRKNFRGDTLSVTNYNSAGKEWLVTRYENNIKKQSTISHYNDHNNRTAWSSFLKNDTTVAVILSYDKQSLLTRTERRDFNKKQIINKTDNHYIYKDDKLVNKEYITNGILNRTDVYNYNNGQLSDYTCRLSKDAYYISGYTYDAANRVVRKVTTHYFGEKSELWNQKDYKYDDQNVIEETEVTYDNKKIITSYEYNADNLLVKMKSVFGNNYREVSFSYKNSKLDKVKVTTNSNSAYLKFYIPFYINDYYEFPFTYEEVFQYDQPGNLISKNAFVNGEKLSETEFLIGYY